MYLDFDSDGQRESNEPIATTDKNGKFIFDNIGPQLLWWAWNPHAASNSPWLDSVPLSSAVLFAGQLSNLCSSATNVVIGSDSTLPWSPGL